MTAAGSTLTDADVERLTLRGLRLAQFAVVYNLAEGAVAIAAGITAGLVSLVGFGLDSGIESVAAVWSGCGWPPDCGTVRPTNDGNGGHCGWSR